MTETFDRLAFAPEEYLARRDALRALMTERGIAAVVLTTWVITTVALVKIAGPLLRCRAIVAAGGLVSVAMCSLFLID